MFRLFINVVLFDRLICCAVAGDLDISQAREFLDKTNSDFAKRIRIALSAGSLSFSVRSKDDDYGDALVFDLSRVVRV